MACDVIIYNITQHADQVEEAFWAVTSMQTSLLQTLSNIVCSSNQFMFM